MWKSVKRRVLRAGKGIRAREKGKKWLCGGGCSRGGKSGKKCKLTSNGKRGQIKRRPWKCFAVVMSAIVSTFGNGSNSEMSAFTGIRDKTVMVVVSRLNKLFQRVIQL